MALNFENLITNLLLELHTFIDWTNRWGGPRSAREETTFFDVQGKINQQQTKLKPFVHKLRLALESFLEDYKKELHPNERIGKAFTEKASGFLEIVEKNQGAMKDEEKDLCEEMRKMIKTAIAQVRRSES